MWDRFYHSLSPSLHNALGLTMAELPEREQVNMSFDTLYMLAKKMEAHQPSWSHSSGLGPSDAYRGKSRRYPMPTGRVATLEDEELCPPDPEVQDTEPPECDQIEGLSVRMTQAMNHFQWEECWCFVCCVMDHFTRYCPHCEICTGHKEHLNFKGGRTAKEGTCPNKTSTAVTAHVPTTCHTSSLFANGPTAHWLGTETLGRIVSVIKESELD